MHYFLNFKILLTISFAIITIISFIFFFAFFAILILPFFLLIYLFRKKLLKILIVKNFSAKKYDYNFKNDKRYEENFIEVDYEKKKEKDIKN